MEQSLERWADRSHTWVQDEFNAVNEQLRRVLASSADMDGVLLRHGREISSLQNTLSVLPLLQGRVASNDTRMGEISEWLHNISFPNVQTLVARADAMKNRLNLTGSDLEMARVYACHLDKKILDQVGG